MGKQISVALHASLARVLTKIATLLPAMFALIVALAIAALLGAALAWALRRVLTSMRFDERMQRNRSTGSLAWTTQRPSLILSRLVFFSQSHKLDAQCGMRRPKPRRRIDGLAIIGYCIFEAIVQLELMSDLCIAFAVAGIDRGDFREPCIG